MKEEKVFIPSGEIQLEGLISIHEAFSFKGGVILCHPHPQYGGDMENLVISAAADAALKEGLSTLRFNFRGVGESGGVYGEGIGEKEDVEAVIDYFNARLEPDRPSLILLGYSFGAWVGVPVAIRDERIVGMVAISPPLDLYDFGLMKECKKKKLIIAGDRDLFCPAPLLEEWYQQLEEPKSLGIIQGADHFFSFHSHLLTQPLRDFFRMLK
ncbi:MAG: alpha/beta hydrolase [Thermodesulfobacteriota bacterium]